MTTINHGLSLQTQFAIWAGNQFPTTAAPAWNERDDETKKYPVVATDEGTPDYVKGSSGSTKFLLTFEKGTFADNTKPCRLLVFKYKWADYPKMSSDIIPYNLTLGKAKTIMGV